MPLVREVSIENYKSIRKLTFELGRVNVLIGANGSGKSNILEAIAFGIAGARYKLDNEYLVPRGGYFGAEEEPVVNHVQPPRDARPKGSGPAPGGWTLVLRSLRAGDHRKALQLNDYVVVHIDTDVCEEPGYDVSRRAADGRSLGPQEPRPGGEAPSG